MGPANKNPRKFRDKIALQNKLQDAKNQEFMAIMKEVSGVKESKICETLGSGCDQSHNEPYQSCCCVHSQGEMDKHRQKHGFGPMRHRPTEQRSSPYGRSRSLSPGVRPGSPGGVAANIPVILSPRQTSGNLLEIPHYPLHRQRSDPNLYFKGPPSPLQRHTSQERFTPSPCSLSAPAPGLSQPASHSESPLLPNNYSPVTYPGFASTTASTDYAPTTVSGYVTAPVAGYNPTKSPVYSPTTLPGYTQTLVSNLIPVIKSVSSAQFQRTSSAGFLNVGNRAPAVNRAPARRKYSEPTPSIIVTEYEDDEISGSDRRQEMNPYLVGHRGQRAESPMDPVQADMIPSLQEIQLEPYSNPHPGNNDDNHHLVNRFNTFQINEFDPKPSLPCFGLRGEYLGAQGQNLPAGLDIDSILERELEKLQDTNTNINISDQTFLHL